MYKILQELPSDWQCDYPQPLYTYLVSTAGKLYAYTVDGDRVITLKHPLTFDKRHRKFKEVVHKGLQSVISTIPRPTSAPVVRLTRSDHKVVDVVSHRTGEVYKVSVFDNGSYSCTCPGYQFRRKCKHGEKVVKEQ